MVKQRILLAIYIFSLLINYNFYVKAYDDPNEEITENNKSEYRSIDDLLKELKEERKLINQQKLDEINQKKLQKETENEESQKNQEETHTPEVSKSKKDTENQNIPKLIVRLRGKHSPKYLCSYYLTISEDNKEIELSKEIINNYSLLMKKPSLKVRPGEVINFEFVPSCKFVKTQIWNEEKDTLEEIKVKRGCIEIPNIDKKVVIIITGNYSNGYINYGIVLDIRK